jgi:hypothetical protein
MALSRAFDANGIKDTNRCERLLKSLLVSVAAKKKIDAEAAVKRMFNL